MKAVTLQIEEIEEIVANLANEPDAVQETALREIDEDDAAKIRELLAARAKPAPAPQTPIAIVKATPLAALAGSSPAFRRLDSGYKPSMDRIGGAPRPQPGAVQSALALSRTAPAALAAAEPDPAIGPQPDPPLAATEPEREQPCPEPEPAARVQLPAVIPPRPVAKYDAAIDTLNTQHAIIDNVGGKTVIASWEPSPLDPSKMVIVFQTKESFLLRYSNRFVSVDIPDIHGGRRRLSQPTGQHWLGHRGRRQHRGVTFMPNGPAETDNGCLNLWQGWGVDPQPGDWSLIRKHIEDIIADGNAEFADYVIRWIAWSIQNPARQAEVALVLIGSKGAGKGTLVRCLQRIFGAHAFQVTSREEVIGKFNGHLQDCILFVADEAYWGGDKRCVGRLQGMITEPTLPIERKGIDVFQVRNFLHMVMLAEPGWVIPAGRYERRYAALAVSDAARGDRAYFKALHDQIDHGGAEAMFHDLQAMDLDGWHPREIPEALLKGSALQKQQGHTLPPLEQWYLGLLHNGVLPGALPTKPNKAPTKTLVEDARAKFPRLRFDLSENGLRDFLIDKERTGVACDKHRTAMFNGWSSPPLAEAREAFDKLYGPIAWDNPEAEEWSKKGSLLD